jgi:hypothetical protein
MDPVRAIRTRATYPVSAGGLRRLVAVGTTESTPNGPRSVVSEQQPPRRCVTGRCYPVVMVAHAQPGKYSEVMTTSMHSPGPRDGLDEGSLAELARDSHEVEVDVRQPRPRVCSRFGRIDVPDDATALIDGLPAYGS